MRRTDNSGEGARGGRGGPREGRLNVMRRAGGSPWRELSVRKEVKNMRKRGRATPEQRAAPVCSKQNHHGRGGWIGIGKIAFEKATLSDLGVQRGNRKKWQCFRVRAGVFASAHGRPNGVPGRIIGARAKTLQGRSGKLEMNSCRRGQAILPRSAVRG
jgi:hypothetical protein